MGHKQDDNDKLWLQKYEMKIDYFRGIVKEAGGRMHEHSIWFERRRSSSGITIMTT